MKRQILVFGNFIFLFTVFSSLLFAADQKMPIVIDGDHVELFNDEKKVIAEGNVVINYKGTKLVADRVIVYLENNDCMAEGNVRIDYEDGILEGDKVFYNFEKGTGSIINADFESRPFYFKAPFFRKVDERQIIMRRGYITTCDLDNPHWRIVAKRVYIFPEDRIEAENASFFIGNWPLVTLAKYVRVLNDRKPRVTVIPGRDKEWGIYLLTAWRYYFNEGAKGRLHLDYREKKDFASGLDFNYEPEGMGKGLLRVYYMHERSIQSSHLYKVPRDTKEKERFRLQWRHKWDLAPNTNLLWEYNKSKDSEFLKDYFFREHEIDSSPNTYMQLTNFTDLYSINVLLEKRINRFVSTLEKLPEVSLETINFRLGASRFYFKSDNKISNLRQRDVGATAFDDMINRFDTYNKMTYSTRLSFLSVSPFLAARNTYYSKDINAENNVMRGIFSGGLDVSTRFFKIFDVKGKILGTEFDQLRHVINPIIEYSYTHQPTVSSSRLHNFDSIDSISKSNSASVSLLNKLQTKRDGNSIDLIAHILSSSYYFKGRNLGGYFSDTFDSRLEIRPKKGIRIDVRTNYDRRKNTVISNDLDFYIDKGDKFYLGVGHRYQRDVDNQFTFDIAYRLNPKWKFRIYERFDFTGGTIKEQQYTINRDLHCWQLEANYRIDRERGESVWFSFVIKAFPELGFEFDTSYHEPKAGSQGY